MSSSNKIETYVLTGFLGSGKTTILNEILKLFPNNNAIIENEFGEINIDSSLIENKYDEIHELSNGCICCSLDNNLIETLEKILKNKKRIHRLFIESTGIADAGSIASTFKNIPVSEHFHLKKIICVIDCEQILEQIKSISEITLQIIASDLIILNKCESQNINRIQNEIEKINPFADIQNSLEKKIKLEWLNKNKKDYQAFFYRPLKNLKTTHNIKSIYYSSIKIFNIESLRFQLQFLLNLYYHQIFRIKGYVQGENNQLYLIQSTGKTIYITLPENNIEKITQLIFIGKELEEKTIARILEPTIVKIN